MSGYRTFAIAGAGDSGASIVDALLSKKNAGIISSVIVLSRSPSVHDELLAKGAQVITIDYSSPTSIQSALSGVDVVISTLPNPLLGAQLQLATLGKAAGVKLFVPSEFGAQTDGPAEGIWGEKYDLKEKLRSEVKLPYAAFYTGVFTDWFFRKEIAELIGFDFAHGKIRIPGEGSSPVSWTTKDDIGRFVAHVLTALPREELEWRIFRIEGDRISLNQISELYKTRSGKEISISHRPQSDMENAITKNPSDDLTAVLMVLDKGHGIVSRGTDELSNSGFPQWNPKKVVDVILDEFNH